MTPSAHRQPKMSLFSGDIDLDVVSTSYYHGDQYAESEGEVSSVKITNVDTRTSLMARPSNTKDKVKEEES